MFAHFNSKIGYMIGLLVIVMLDGPHGSVGNIFHSLLVLRTRGAGCDRKIDPFLDFRIRGDALRVMRLSRKALAALGGAASLGIGGSLYCK
ncbi:hypothetical protein F9288_12665 [Sphingomonas sp. CL5.1]|uniref:hypothetical protein n=1 Tax=Sphingomonas sp. CL5.1 TaxID=2653203 RepID=UPI0015840D62|nr:hypothetical protein [Sphingomonas sp. CL5.1]QKR98214.1 hypothetical protein F9288_12665 [Sphingomonas sp. CL5.1]